MNILGNVPSDELFTICFALFLVILVLFYWKVGKKRYRLPPGPTGVPILGYIPFLGQEPYKKLDSLKKIYGNVFSLYMGRTFSVIVGDFEAVKEAFSKSTTTDKPLRVFDFLPDGAGFSGSNGEEWMEQRKFCLRSMKDLGIGKSKWESVIQVEVDDIVKLISSFNSKPVDIYKILTSSISNNFASFMFEKRLSFNHPDRKFLDNVIDEIMLLLGQTTVYNIFPIARDISLALGIGRFAKAYKRLKKFNNFFRKEVKELRESYSSGKHDNFIVEYLKEMDNFKDKPRHHFNESSLYGNIQGLFLGGSETARTSIYWLLLIMAKFPNIQTKIQNELDSILGRDRRIQWSERKTVPFTFAAIMEGQRWRTIVPLNTPRIATEDIKLQNYDIPKGTHIIANIWGLHNDSKYWQEPDVFNPERFLTEDGKQIITKPESYNPFSYGKRNCPGETIALMEILLYFTALMQKFTVVAPKGRELNMDGQLGMTYHPASQELHFVCREQ